MNSDSIAINGRFLSQPITGVQRYAFELLGCLDCLLSANSLPQVPVTVFVPKSAASIPRYSFLQIRQVGSREGRIWEQVDLPSYCRGSVLFTPCGGAPIMHDRHIITIHDAGPFSTPEAYRLPYRVYYRALQRYLARKALHILTVSEFSRRELMRVLPVEEKRISCAHLSGEHVLRFERSPEILSRHNLVRGAYVLGVSSANPNKNFAGLMKAARRLDASGIPVVIAGNTNSRVFGGSDDVPGCIRQTGFVTDAELRTLYENAGCLAFPSFYEGFGLPPLEALTVGCPVVVSNTSSLPEVFGNAATYCNPYSPEDIALRISQVMHGRHPARQIAQTHAESFRWEMCARTTWKILLGATSSI
ncbi:glycosyltransferase family 4 protein [Paracidobacterium acidisoli]|nr:glycosyltransferase family 1 protein [Paracidobacterium acidisoli]MBT9331244.1 glycosyltransferase family 4 protein [Paracidobacterium acidisoli]